MEPATRGRLVRALKLVVSTSLVGVVLVIIARTEGIEQVPRRFASIDGRAWLLAAMLQGGSVLVGVARWRRLLLWQGLAMPYPRLLRIYLVGRFYGAFAPGTTGLDVYRAVQVAQITGETAKSTIVIAVEKVFGLLGLALCAVAMLPLGAARFFGPSANVVAFLAALGSLAMLLLVLRPRRLATLARPLPAGIRKRVEGIAERLDATPPSAGALLWLVVLAMTSHTLTALCYAASGLAIGVDASLSELAVVGFAIVVAMLVPVSVGGAGVREGTAVLLLRAVGVPASDALLVAVLGYLATQPPALAGGLVQFWNRQTGSLKS